MSKRNAKKTYIIDQTTIEGLSSEAKGIVRHEGKVIFVDQGVTGDLVQLSAQKAKKNYDTATITRIIKPSPLRQQPHCSHYELCGGCKIQHLSYTAQLEWKTQVLKDALDRIAQIPYPSIEPILGCTHTEQYRNKLDFACSNQRWLTPHEIQTLPQNSDRSGIGFHKAGAYDKVVDINTCHHMPPLADQIRNFIKNKAQALQIPLYDIKLQTGVLRNILIRNSTIGEWMVCISCFEITPEVDTLLASIRDQFPDITSLLYTHNPKGNDTIYDLNIHTYSGRDYIYEMLGDKKFKIGPKSFFQTNTEQCHRLYIQIAEMANIQKHHTLYDLYCGVGSIGIFVSDLAQKVVGIELVPEAIQDAHINLELNNISNCQFFAADMRMLFGDTFVQTHGRPDIIITDPPRAGMHPDVINQLLNLEAPTIVYVSCNPHQLANELKVLHTKYDVIRIKPVDMFPHTLHLETIALLKLRT